MELKTVDLSAVYFPKTEWRWLRSPVRFPIQLKSNPDAFLFAANVDGKIWGWHPVGTGVETYTDNPQCRVLILETSGTELEAHSLFLKTTAELNRGLQDVEWVAALQVLTERFKFDPAQKGLPHFWSEALVASGLSPHLGALAQRDRFRYLSLEEEKYIFEKKWDLSTFEIAETLSTEVRTQFLQTLRKWNLTAAQSKEALNNIFILTKKIGEKVTLNILKKEYQNVEELRTALAHTAQPEFAILSQKRLEKLRGLRLPPRTAVFGDPSFEKDVLKITHNPRSIADFELFKEWVEEVDTLEKMRALLEIYQ